VTPATELVDPFSTAGCRGADGFFRCDVTNAADATVAPMVSAVATVFIRKSRTALDGDRRS
jgi:hypothetical protein